MFIELSEMGSTILANPAMERANRQLQAEIYFVIFNKNKASLQLLNTVTEEHIFTLRENNLLVLLIDTAKFLYWTRKKHIDTVIDLELFSRFTALLTGLSGAERRVGFYSFHNEGLYRGELLTHRVSYNPHMHIAKNFIALVYALEAKVEEIPYSKIHIPDKDIILPTVHPTLQEQKRMQGIISNRFQDYDPEYHKIVLINPNASGLLPQRRWMPERYQELAERIVDQRKNLLILITGASSESEGAELLCRRVRHHRCVNFTGAVTLVELPVLYSIALLMVTNDSGPGHFSAITELPTFVLFGPETPALYGSLGHSTPIYAGLACSPLRQRS
ncbi:glycosyltransferase family 9 protein [Desulfogranum japonicum]|uniref:glycosyltransferase family 9 protein n=1 Tax=Desulfogranum japonicum TaxID=231447 RepID=UPI001969F48C|nr:glycosyltransferase family 9 protein [Desulfogranum japonicum]